MGLASIFRTIKSVLLPNFKEGSGDLKFTKNELIGPNITIGEFTYGLPKILFNNPETKLIIGKFCSISTGVEIFLGGNHRIDWVSTYPFNAVGGEFEGFSAISGHPASKGDVEIGNDVWIGRDVTILSGVKIGNGAILGASSVITKNVGNYEVWAGNPAKFIRKRFDDETIDKLQNLQWWDWPLKKIKDAVPTLMEVPGDGLNSFLTDK